MEEGGKRMGRKTEAQFLTPFKNSLKVFLPGNHLAHSPTQSPILATAHVGPA